MSTKTTDILDRIKNERDRQNSLHGSEMDSKNSPGDWVSMVGHYLMKDVRRNGVYPSKENYEDSLIKAAAVIVAALEHTEIMENRKELI
ncbi:hypothetical protein FDI40_gp249 [Agrobacterium phage Atu_ph07]|uniref:Uncharacterized protein n=1 Tax=Agrobacterium phage Atu_ph07 TaxID=2024264 RepID=A0A2L0UZT8_9CAUD|nr:hypothetical protein FDI40_gp249 [Agrobacterium phage Atu_ph07]AUZ95030.1 hypothetical protein [Agrobacterium phage Atu_ph07]